MTRLTLHWTISFVATSTIFFWAADVRGQPLPGGTLNPLWIPKYVESLTIPPVMPKAPRNPQNDGARIDYEIAARQILQQVLPNGLPRTTVWAYGPANDPPGDFARFNYPAFTIEAKVGLPVRVKWVNDLVNQNTREFLHHLFEVDQTLHWAAPNHSEHDIMTMASYDGPIPLVTHLHGGHTSAESDGHPDAWWLPDAIDIPSGYMTEGELFGQIQGSKIPVEPGAAVFEYANDQAATTLWYHDHALGITRQNVYAGLAGFYLLRGGKTDLPLGQLPGPAPAPNDPPGKRYYEIPIAIQDRSFNADGSLFYPDSRAFFDGYAGPYLPDPASDISPIWNPEAFFNTMVVNGKTWPYLEVEARRYRLRLLNGCNSRFLILALSRDPMANVKDAETPPFWQIGAEGGFLDEPVSLDNLLMAPAERADVIVDFTNIAPGTRLYLVNRGPDEPFGGGIPGVDFPIADQGTTGQVMEFRVVARNGSDMSMPPDKLKLPKHTNIGPAAVVRKLSLNELDSDFLCAQPDEDMTTVGVPCELYPDLDPVGPRLALLGTLDDLGEPVPMLWDAETTENIRLGDTEIWEIHNFTMDAHPIHPHLVQFEVINREPMMSSGMIRGPEPWETGLKDTVVAYPGEITRIKATFDRPGDYVWHCHILEHEDNEMMRPFVVEMQ